MKKLLLIMSLSFGCSVYSMDSKDPYRQSVYEMTIALRNDALQAIAIVEQRPEGGDKQERLKNLHELLQKYEAWVREWNSDIRAGKIVSRESVEEDGGIQARARSSKKVKTRVVVKKKRSRS